MEFLKKLLSENSDVSSMRVMAFISLFSAIGLAFTNKSGYEAFIYAAFVGKGIQKFSELTKKKEEN